MPNTNYLVRVGECAGNIEDCLKQYSDHFLKTTEGITSIPKYCLLLRYEGNKHYMTVSQADTNPEFNVLVTVIGDSNKGNMAIMNDFESNMPFKLRRDQQVEKRIDLVLRQLGDYIRNATAKEIIRSMAQLN